MKVRDARRGRRARRTTVDRRAPSRRRARRRDDRDRRPTTGVTYASRRRASTATTDATESARRQVRTAIKKLCEACRIVRRRGRLFVVCAKTPKHKQRQGVHTGARERERGERATTLAASGEEALARTCCESVRGGDGFDARGLALTGNYRRHAAMPSLLPRIAQF